MNSKHANFDHLLRFQTEDSSLTGKLRIEQPDAERITREGLVAYLLENDVKEEFILQDELDALIKDLHADTTQAHERVVARGKSPQNGINAQVVLCNETADDYERIQKRKEAFRLAQQVENGLKHDTDTSIDFYNDSAFVTVREGDHIADFIEDTQGSDGIDIFGRPIVAKTGKPISKPCDASCRIDDNGQIIALQDGLLQFDRDRVSIQSTLDITGSVDFSTGNVDFPGDVVIHKNVRDRFKVNADHTLEVHKLVEAAHLQSLLGIKLHQGMAGRDSGTIRTRGDLECGYLDAVDAVIDGDCTVEKEVTNCTIRIAGKFMARNASVRGGLIELTKGGEIGNLGSARGVPTSIVLGAHPVLQQQLTRINEVMPKLTAELDIARRKVVSFKAAMGKGNSELQTEIFFLESIYKTLQTKHDQLEEARERIVGLFAKHTSCELTVYGHVFSKTKIWLPGECAVFERDLDGEFTIRLDEQTGKPVIDWGEQVEPLNKVVRLRADDRVPARPKPQGEESAERAA